jgi:hypothetical protein
MEMKEDILQETEEQQLRWYGHFMRTEDCKIGRKVVEWNPQGKRRRGGPAVTWKDGFRDSTQRRNLKDEECFDRELWRGGKLYSQKILFNNKKHYDACVLFWAPFFLFSANTA